MTWQPMSAEMIDGVWVHATWFVDGHWVVLLPSEKVTKSALKPETSMNTEESSQ